MVALREQQDNGAIKESKMGKYLQCGKSYDAFSPSKIEVALIEVRYEFRCSFFVYHNILFS